MRLDSILASPHLLAPGWPLAWVAIVVLTLAALLGAPRHQLTARNMATTILATLAGLALATSHGVLTICLLLPVSLLPLLLVARRDSPDSAQSAALFLLGVTLVPLAVALFVVCFAPAHASIAFACVLVALMARMGAFPLHLWLPALAEEAPLPVLAWTATAPLPAFLLARLSPLLSHDLAPYGQEALLVIGTFGAMYGSVLALGQTHMRRMLAYLVVGQAGTVMVAVAVANPDSAAGVLLASIGYSLPSLGLFLLVSAIESRTGSARLDQMHGLASPAPHLAAAFLVLGFAEVGFPGSLGFVAEDVMLHGILATHPWMGAVLLLATAINAITMFRCFQRVFLGPLPRDRRLDAIPDLLPRERLVAIVLALLIMIAGTVPAAFVDYAHHSAALFVAASGGEP